LIAQYTKRPAARRGAIQFDFTSLELRLIGDPSISMSSVNGIFRAQSSRGSSWGAR
jgi:hypothetical protein